ncbi:YdeI/OmpD-associated family protein [Paenibacillus pedocola]|uniref:YdeI/OmpD-associated family protein n=1 Tax=Paenibacillus pedocola TaxID=3242193 RepID=UPI002877BFC6|nr:YdeI/OmpD-associated family protein [Paenibacillus typhae]
MIEALIKKLRIPLDGSLLVLQPPEGYMQELGLDAEAARLDENRKGTYDYVQLFAANVQELEQFSPEALAAVRPDGLLWLCYPKGSSSIKTDLSRDKGWGIVKDAGFEGVSLISINDTWSAMRFRPLGATTRRSGTTSRADNPKTPAAPLPVPDDLLEALEINGAAKSLFQGLAPSHRKAYITWITDAKRAETRASRIVQTVEKLLLGRKNPADNG